MFAEIILVLKLVLAAALGSVVGTERELHERPAGLRTHALVCMGATLFISLAMLITPVTLDSSAQARVMAGVITGIGFLGAGAIIRHKEGGVIGLTTAADIWVVAAIGIAVGLGYYIAALAASILILFLLWFGKAIKRSL